MAHSVTKPAASKTKPVTPAPRSATPKVSKPVTPKGVVHKMWAVVMRHSVLAENVTIRLHEWWTRKPILVMSHVWKRDHLWKAYD